MYYDVFMSSTYIGVCIYMLEKGEFDKTGEKVLITS